MKRSFADSRFAGLTRAWGLAAFLLASCGLASAAEVTSNGTGGGAWSEAGTWRGNALLKSDDEVAIRKRGGSGRRLIPNQPLPRHILK